MSDTQEQSVRTHRPDDFTEPAIHLTLPPHYEPPMLEPRPIVIRPRIVAPA